MTKILEFAKELGISKEQLKDTAVQQFLLQALYRKQTKEWYQFINGNGYCEINKKNGTLITTVLTDEEFKPEFPLNIDCGISMRCDNGCSFCYLGCSPKGKEANIRKYIEDKNSWLYTLHPGTEIALNGNSPLHKDLGLLLEFLKERDIIANLTVRENTLYENQGLLEKWLKEGLIHGIGISPSTYSFELIDFCKEYPSAVIHTIAGITTKEEYDLLKDKGLKILILGYKDCGRGLSYEEEYIQKIEQNIKDLKNELQDYTKHFKVVSFDNKALEQLDVKKLLTEKEWSRCFRGEEGNHTFYIDLVNETYALNSMTPRSEQKPLLNDVREMLKNTQNWEKNKNGK